MADSHCQPLHKKGLDLIHKNYRPVFNLCFLSKLVEKCMLCQQIDHCNSNNLLPDFQSAYRSNYSTETSLIKITNDIPWAMENQRAMIMILLDLSAAFDTVDHNILINILVEHYGFCDKPLSWFEQYLRLHNIMICINAKYSNPKPLDFSVPQGSCSGANIFTRSCSLIENIIPHDTMINGFTNYHLLRRTCKVTDKENGTQNKNSLQTTFINIQKWMDTMGQKLNSGKIEYIQFASTKHIEKLDTSPFNANGDLIELSIVVRYLAGYLNRSLTFMEHIRKARIAMAKIIKIKSIWKFLTQDGGTTLLLMLCISHLDYANVMLYCILEKNMKQISNHSEHLCQDSIKQIQVFQLHPSTEDTSLATDMAMDTVQDINSQVQMHT